MKTLLTRLEVRSELASRGDNGDWGKVVDSGSQQVSLRQIANVVGEILETLLHNDYVREMKTDFALDKHRPRVERNRLVIGGNQPQNS